MTTWTLTPISRTDSIADGESVDGSSITPTNFLASDDPLGITVASNLRSGHLGDWFSVQQDDRDDHAAGAATIRIIGDCPWLDRIGGAAPGSPIGMNGGRIIVTGRIGSLVGHRMRRGEIMIDGQAGKYLGFKMLAGTIIVTSDLGESPMLSAKRGTLIHGRPIRGPFDRFSRPMPIQYPYASLVTSDGYNEEINALLTACSRHGVTTRRGDLSVGGQAELICPRI